MRSENWGIFERDQTRVGWGGGRGKNWERVLLTSSEIFQRANSFRVALMMGYILWRYGRLGAVGGLGNEKNAPRLHSSVESVLELLLDVNFASHHHTVIDTHESSVGSKCHFALQ